MALQFRAVVPYTLSGVLAIIGWWWFFSRRKNRTVNQTGRPIANGQEQLTETIPSTPVEDAMGETSPLLQNNPDEISESCIAVPKFLSFELDSKTFGNSSGSKIGAEHLHSGDLLNSESSVLARASSSQQPSSSLLQRSAIETAQECDYMEKNLCHQTENAMYKDVQNLTKDGSLNYGTAPVAVAEMVDYICNASILGECGDALTEMKELKTMEREATAHGDSNVFLKEFVDDAPYATTDMSSGEQEIQMAAVAKEMTDLPQCSKIDSSVTVETMVETDVQYEFGKVASTNVAHKVTIKNVVPLSDCNEIGSSCSVDQSVFLDGETVHQILCNDITACHPVANEEIIVCYTDSSDHAFVAAFDEIDVVQKSAFHTTEVGDILSKDALVHTLINQDAIHTTYSDAGASTNEDAFALHQKKANESIEVSVSNLVDKGHKTTVPLETPVQAATIEYVYSCNNASQVNDGNTQFMEFNEMDNSDDSEHTKLATAVDHPECDIIRIMKNITLPCAATVRENPSLNVYSEVISTVESVLPLERATKAAKLLDPFTDYQGPTIVFPTGKERSTDLAKEDCLATPAQVLAESMITCAELPTVVYKDAITSGMVESSTITSTDEMTLCELRKHYFDEKVIQQSAVDFGINLDLSLTDNPKESVVVGILLNSYVEPPPLLKVETLCMPTVFPQCLGEDEQLKVTEVEKVNLQMVKEIDFGKHEVEAIEQLAIRIVSQVILAATREILSSDIVDLPGVSCHVIENQEGSSVGLENGMSLPGPISAVVNVLESNMLNNISKNQTVGNTLMAEQHMRDDISHLNASENLSLLSPQQVTVKESKPKCSRQTEHNEPKGTEFPTEKEPFGNANIAAEDSGCSVCMSEDGVNAEDPLQSLGLSTKVCTVELFDILTTSGIAKTNTDHSALTVDTPKSSSLQGNINEPDGNSEMKSNSPELTQERHWSLETDHSGGSDVNSMDSVDSGCALGKTENNQDNKPGLESKKSDLTVWEVEVPKHLVGRLIGKQGRYVSFLKQTSGAKIYISTLPYTQEFQICHIEGTQPQVDKALNQIGKKFKELNLTNIYAPPPLTLPALPMTSWLMLPDGVTVEVIVVNVVNAGHMFVQQHTHPTFHALRSLDQQMFLCYSQPGIPVLPTPVEVGVICAAPGSDKAWWRAQVVSFYTESDEVEIRYVDYGGYERVKVDILRQIRSDFVTLPFQGSEVLLDNVVPLPDEDHFSSEADVTVNEMTRGTALLAQVTNYDGSTGLPLIQLWSMLADEVVSINRSLVERGFAQWIDCY